MTAHRRELPRGQAYRTNGDRAHDVSGAYAEYHPSSIRYGLESNRRYVFQRLLTSDHADEQGSPSGMKQLKHLALALF